MAQVDNHIKYDIEVSKKYYIWVRPHRTLAHIFLLYPLLIINIISNELNINLMQQSNKYYWKTQAQAQKYLIYASLQRFAHYPIYSSQFRKKHFKSLTYLIKATRAAVLVGTLPTNFSRQC